MKKLICLLLVINGLNLNAQKTKNKELSFTVSGTAIGNPNGFIIFSKVLDRKKDTVAVKNGTFTYKGKLKETFAFNVVTQDTKSDLLFIEPGKNTITVNYKEQPLVTSTGTAHKSYISFIKTINPVVEYRNALSQKSKQQDGPSAEAMQADDSVQRVFTNYLANPQTNPTVAAFLVISNLEQMQGASYEVMEGLYNKLTPAAQSTTLGIYGKNMINRTVADEIGRIAPDFTLKDSSNNPITLSQFRGKKFVLVDFWASWCGPCRAEFPALKKAQEKYSDKLVILGVSIDSDKDKWLKILRQADYTNWLHVWDGPQGPNQIASTLYNVPSIPRNFLLDLNGKVIAKNLRGPLVESELEKWVK